MDTNSPPKCNPSIDEEASDTLSDIDVLHNDLNKQIAKRVEDFWREVPYDEAPPVPRQVLVEVANRCNHACVFCAYTKMTRPKGVLDLELFTNLMRQAYDLGSREAGLYSGAEPLTVKNIADYIRTAKDIGYEYVYITSNGSPANEERIEAMIDAGLDSLKFSINGGTRETYKAVHGQDHFDRVIHNLRYADEYRKKSGRKMYLSASFVQCEENEGTYDALKEMIGEYVDEVFFTKAYNQAGQMDLAPPHTFKNTCAVPFARLNITQEGYLRLCCNDYQNFLVTEDLNTQSLAEAWNSPRMREIRRRHLSDQLDGTLCHNCMKGTRDKISPLNSELCDLPQI